MIHAIGLNGHGKKFQAVCQHAGLINEGACSLDANNRSPELNSQFSEIIKELGLYPHVQMKPPEKKKVEKTEKKKTYMKFFSPDNADYWVYIRTTLVQTYGPPIDPTSKKPMEELKDAE
jgi:hypothetical protein